MAQLTPEIGAKSQPKKNKNLDFKFKDRSFSSRKLKSCGTSIWAHLPSNFKAFPLGFPTQNPYFSTKFQDFNTSRLKIQSLTKPLTHQSQNRTQIHLILPEIIRTLKTKIVDSGQFEHVLKFQVVPKHL